MDTTSRGLNDASPERLRREIEETRADLGATLGALQRRRRQITNVRRIVRLHPIAVVATAAAVLVGMALVVALRERRFRYKGYRAVRRAALSAEREAREKSALRKAAEAGLSAIAAAGARRYLLGPRPQRFA